MKYINFKEDIEDTFTSESNLQFDAFNVVAGMIRGSFHLKHSHLAHDQNLWDMLIEEEYVKQVPGGFGWLGRKYVLGTWGFTHMCALAQEVENCNERLIGVEPEGLDAALQGTQFSPATFIIAKSILYNREPIGTTRFRSPDIATDLIISAVERIPVVSVLATERVRQTSHCFENTTLAETFEEQQDYFNTMTLLDIAYLGVEGTYEEFVVVPTRSAIDAPDIVNLELNSPVVARMKTNGTIRPDSGIDHELQYWINYGKYDPEYTEGYKKPNRVAADVFRQVMEE